MEHKLAAFIRKNGLLSGGETVCCAVSGGADSMALLWGMYLLREKLGITLEAVHFNHHLRGDESDADEAFVREFCDFHDIPLTVSGSFVTAGDRGLEAAAREARYGFFRTLPGVVATAHTADDNAETVLMHLLRGTGLRGLGGIAPKAPGLIRPMLDITRSEVEAFLAEHWISYRTDSSNRGDDFLRNRLRHHVMPLLKGENPSLAVQMSAMAQRLRQENTLLETLSTQIDFHSVPALAQADPALRRRSLENLLKAAGLPEPNSSHIAQAEALVFAQSPSAFARFPGGVLLRRRYEVLEWGAEAVVLEPRALEVGQTLELHEIGLTIRCTAQPENGSIPVYPQGPMVVRSRQAGDTFTTSGGTKSLKKRFADLKIPQHQRLAIPVIADAAGVLAVANLGTNLSRAKGAPAYITITRQPDGA